MGKISREEFLEAIGFFFEIICFLMAGFFIWISLIATVMFFICGMILAFYVGGMIKKNAKKGKGIEFIF